MAKLSDRIVGNPITILELLNPPTANELHYIGGVGDDYSTLEQFLTAQQHRFKNQYTITGRLRSGYVQSTPITMEGGSFEKVTIDSEDLLMGIGTTTCPFNFYYCTVTPVFDLDLEYRSMAAFQYGFYAEGCLNVPIADKAMWKAGGEDVGVMYKLVRCPDAFMIGQGGSYNDVSFAVFEVTGGKLLLDEFTHACNSILAVGTNGAVIDTNKPTNSEFVVYTTANCTQPYYIHVDADSSVRNADIRAFGRTFSAAVVTSEGGNLSNVQIQGLQCQVAFDLTATLAREIYTDFATYTSYSLTADDSQVWMTNQNAGNGGGAVNATASVVFMNKADSVTYAEGSRIRIGTLATPHVDDGKITPSGSLITNATSPVTRRAEIILFTPYSFTPDIGVRGEQDAYYINVTVEEVSTGKTNIYHTVIVDQVDPEGVEIEETATYGEEQHSFVDPDFFDVQVDPITDTIRLMIPTYGSGDELKFSYQIVEA